MTSKNSNKTKSLNSKNLTNKSLKTKSLNSKSPTNKSLKTKISKKKNFKKEIPEWKKKHKFNKVDKAFIDKFESQVKDTIKQFKLINKKKDKVLVAVSGGKDSTVLLYLLKKFKYPIEALTIDVLIGSYTKANLENIKIFCNDLGVKLNIVTFRQKFGYSVCYMKSMLNKKGVNLKSCTICGVMRRYLLNKNVRLLGATKVATGHNLDDEAQSFLMNLIRNKMKMNARLGPSPGLVKDDRFVTRIKPLYLHAEKDIERYSKLMKFPVHYGACPCSVDAFRNRIKQYLKLLDEKMPKKEIKRRLVTQLISVLPQLKKRFESEGKPDVCTSCGEPSNSKTCRTCQILEHMSADSKK